MPVNVLPCRGEWRHHISDSDQEQTSNMSQRISMEGLLQYIFSLRTAEIRYPFIMQTTERDTDDSSCQIRQILIYFRTPNSQLQYSAVIQNCDGSDQISKHLSQFFFLNLVPYFKCVLQNSIMRSIEPKFAASF